MLTKKQMVDCVVKFMANDLMPRIEDKKLKFTLCLAKRALLENESVMDGFLRSPMVSSVMKEQGGEFDAEAFLKILRSVLGESGYYRISVPKIPLFAPKESELTITTEDIDKLMAYLKAVQPTA